MKLLSSPPELKNVFDFAFDAEYFMFKLGFLWLDTFNNRIWMKCVSNIFRLEYF